jgi:hypothetical protein
MPKNQKRFLGMPLYYPHMKQISCERTRAKKKRNYDLPKTPLQRLLEQPFEDKLEGRRVKLAALKEAAALVEQKQRMDAPTEAKSFLGYIFNEAPRPLAGTGLSARLLLPAYSAGAK